MMERMIKVNGEMEVQKSYIVVEALHELQASV